MRYNYGQRQILRIKCEICKQKMLDFDEKDPRIIYPDLKFCDCLTQKSYLKLVSNEEKK